MRDGGVIRALRHGIDVCIHHVAFVVCDPSHVSHADGEFAPCNQSTLSNGTPAIFK